jgi:hypothetical protein
LLFVLPAKGLWVDNYVPVRQRLEQVGVVVKTTVGPPPRFGGPPGGFAPGYAYPALEPGNNIPPVPADLRFGPELDLTGFRAVVFVGKDVGDFLGPKGGPEKEKFGPPKDGSHVIEQVIHQAQERKLVLGGVGIGQLILAKHGALDGRAAARCEWAMQWGGPYLSPRVRLEDVAVKTDGRVVTSAGLPDTAAAFADALAAAMRE